MVKDTPREDVTGLKLSSLLSPLLRDGVCLSDTLSPQDKSLAIRKITDDSREVEPGTLFVAISGQSRDGHSFIPQAVRQGAAALVTEHKVPGLTVPAIAVQDGRRALGLLLAAFYRHPDSSFRLVGVSGTNGKTTTTFMVSRILERAGKRTGLIGTLAIKTGKRVNPSPLTTPEATELYPALAEMRRNRVHAVVMEVSSHGLALQRVAGLWFDAAVFTNLTRDHLDFHASFQEYVAVKRRLLDQLAPRGVLIYNADDPVLSQFPGKSPSISFGIGHPADVTAEDISNDGRRLTFLLKLNRTCPSLTGQCHLPGSFRIRLGTPGLHNVYNTLAAAVTVLYLGGNLESVAEGLLDFAGVHRRFEVIFEGPFLVIDDFAHNPDGIRRTLATALQQSAGRMVVVHAIRGNRGVEVNQENASALAVLAPHHDATLITTSSHDTVTPHDRVTPLEEEAFLAVLASCGLRRRHFPLLRDALETALDEVKPGGLLLLLGAQGMDHGAAIIQSILAQRGLLPLESYDELEGPLTTIPLDQVNPPDCTLQG